MARLNKGRALEAMVTAVHSNPEVLNADPRDLRLMTGDQMRQSVGRLMGWDTTMINVLADTFPRYVDEVNERGRREIVSLWFDKIHTLETSDPVLVAERSDRAFVMTVDGMIDRANETLARFMDRLKVDPAYAFTSTDAVQAAADLNVARQVKQYLETRSPAEIKQHLLEGLRYHSGLQLNGSSSPMVNMVERAKAISTMKLAGLRS